MNGKSVVAVLVGIVGMFLVAVIVLVGGYLVLSKSANDKQKNVSTYISQMNS